MKLVSPPVLPIQFGTRNEQMPILRQGTFIQFESSQKMNGVFVALLLREREKRRSNAQKKKNDDGDSDADNQPKAKKEQLGFQFETEMRAAQRKQHQQQQQQQPTTPKSQRKSTTVSSSRRAKSSAAMARDLATTSTARFEPTTAQTPQPAPPASTEPRELTLSERLASIGRITSTLETTPDETPTNNDLNNQSHSQVHRSIYNQIVFENTRIIEQIEPILFNNNKEHNQSSNFHFNNTHYQAKKLSLTLSPHTPSYHLIPAYSSNDQINRRYLYRNRSRHKNLPITQCKITLENSKDIIQRCHACKLNYQSKCIHYHEQYDIHQFLRKLHIRNRMLSKTKTSKAHVDEFQKVK
ncbi:unnamed protein product [Rotaria socialis]|uniref:Uncharacterized protein n=1 Tax=Rotaria socialis TaxID=392032 RepID=A0A821UDG0_9BILA|nr:unnamed protein product [Rotaria socialis]